MLEEGEVLTLNNNKQYTVVYSCVYNSENYAYLISHDDLKDSMFCKLDNNNGLVLVTDNNVIQKILEMFKNDL